MQQAVALKTRSGSMSLSFRDGQVFGMVKEDEHSAKGKIPATLEGLGENKGEPGNPRLALNSRYVADFLKSTDAAKVEILIKDDTKEPGAVVLRPLGDKTTTAVIMPMRDASTDYDDGLGTGNPAVGTATDATGERGSFSFKRTPSKADYRRVELYRRLRAVIAHDKGKTGRAELLLHAHNEDPADAAHLDLFLTPVQKAIFEQSPNKDPVIRGTPELSRYRNRNVAKALKVAIEDPTAKGYGEAQRRAFVGERNVRVAEANQLRERLKKQLPDHVDQEALSLYRDFKNRPGELEEFRNGTHRDLKNLEPNEHAAAMLQIKKLNPVIDRALHPTADMLAADQELTKHFAKTLKEGKDLGFLDSNWSNEEYISHLLQPRASEPENLQRAKGMSKAMGNKIGRYFQFGQKRFYPTLLHAVASGLRPRTLNALDAMAIHGEKHARAAATQLLINQLKESGIGMWGTGKSGNIPKGWVELAGGTHQFRNHLALKDEEGNAHSVQQTLFVPAEVDKALKPITSPNSMNEVAGFRGVRMYQAALKAAELSLSIFHMRALSLAAASSLKGKDLLPALNASMDSPLFTEEERDFVRAGGTTPVLAQTLEAYQGLQPSALPTTLDVIRGLPGIRQADQVAKAITHATFDVMQRKFKVLDYATKKAAWIADNPAAGEPEFDKAKAQIAKYVNAVYGGLNWEVMGVNRATLEVSRALLLAPDWTFSNFASAKYSFEGGPGGAAARMFWIKSAAIGLGLTAAMSLFLTGKPSHKPTSVYMGEDDQGREVYQNLFFSGAPSDMLKLIDDATTRGAFFGVAQFMAGKAAPIPRATLQMAMNENWLHQPIIPKNVDNYEVLGHEVPDWVPPPILKTMIGAGWLVSQATPIPFSITNAVSMLLDQDKTYSPAEYAGTILGGARPRHEATQ